MGPWPCHPYRRSHRPARRHPAPGRGPSGPPSSGGAPPPPSGPPDDRGAPGRGPGGRRLLFVLLAAITAVVAVSLLVLWATRDGDGPDREPAETATGTGVSPDPSLGVPSELPSGLPSRLPSGFPTDLPSELPSGFPTDLPSGLPSHFPSGLESLLPSLEDVDLP